MTAGFVRSVSDMAPRLVLLCVLALALLAAGCGGDEEEPAGAPSPTPAGDAATDLVVRVDADGPDGGGEAKEERVRCAAGDTGGACEAAASLEPTDFEKSPPDVACTDIFGGPQTAEVSGTLRGERIDATFSRADGCEIARWDRAAPLLEQVG